MTNGEARRTGRAGGYALRIRKTQGMETYLCDYRRGKGLTTAYPAEAEWFECEHEAREMAERASFYTGFDFEVTQVPADARPRRASSGSPCPCCGSRRTAKVAGGLRCFGCGLSWTPEPCGCSEDTLGRVEAAMAQDAVRAELGLEVEPDEALALMREMAEAFDDEDAEVVSASLAYPGGRFHLPVGEVP